jgi:hypothetical protein
VFPLRALQHPQLQLALEKELERLDLAHCILHVGAPGVEAVPTYQVADAIRVFVQPRLNPRGESPDILVVFKHGYQHLRFMR